LIARRLGSRFRGRLARLAWKPFVVAGVSALSLASCGRVDIELSAPNGPAGPPEDCSASVPLGLVAARPPMGWNGYNWAQCEPELNEAKVEAISAAMTASGMQSAGYRYVNLDACWQVGRSADGQRLFDAVRLPSGIEALSEQLHGRGQLLGVYSHVQDCGTQPGSEGHEVRDAEDYRAWRVDYVKHVQCGPGTQVSRKAVSDLAAALAASGRPVVFNLDSPPFQEWMRDEVQAWRTSSDAEPNWSSIVKSIDATVPLAAYARPGAFNDPDALEIGNGALSEGEQRVQFSVWSILSAPLIAGNDLSLMSETTRSILTNAQVIALNQDPLGLQAARIPRDGDLEILAKPLAECGARAVVLWNRGEAETEASLTWNDLWLEPETALVRDLWGSAALTTSSTGFEVAVPPHDAVALRVQGVEPPLPSGRVYLSDLKWTYATNGWGPVELDTTNGETPELDGHPIRLRGAAYEKGLGVHGPSLIRYRLGQACSRFIADVGIDDDQGGHGSAQFEIWADGELLFESGTLTGTSPVSTVSVDVSGRRDLRLFVGRGGDGHELDHGVWAGAVLECANAGQVR
jgi:alpha-galactosidase